MLLDGELLAEIEIQNGGRPPSWIFVNLTSENWDPCAADFPSLYQIWCKNVDRRRNYSPKSKSKMVAVLHRGFVTSSYRTTHEVYSLGYIGFSNFMLIRCIVFKIWRFQFFVDLVWNAFSHHQNYSFWGSEPVNVIGHHRDPQKAHPWPKPHWHANFGADRSTGANWARAEVIKKERKKARKETFSGASVYLVWPRLWSDLFL